MSKPIEQVMSRRTEQLYLAYIVTSYGTDYRLVKAFDEDEAVSKIEDVYNGSAQEIVITETII